MRISMTGKGKVNKWQISLLQKSESLICILCETFEVKFCGKKIYDEDFETGNNNKKILSWEC